MGVMAPAMAETFPTDGYMKENKTYDNAATETNMDGVYEGSVNAVAEYDTIDYILSAGKYLPADSETITTCPAGSFCAGGETVQYNQSSAQGIETCPTGYDSSADGSSSNTQCYRTCDINNMGTSFTNIAHATAVSGNDYYGNGADTCEPTGCVNGWHLKPGTPDLMTVIGSSEGATGRTANTSTGSERISDNMSNTIIANDPMAFAVDYGTKGIIKGHGRCSTRSATYPWASKYTMHSDNVVSSLTDETGQEGAKNCYCHLDSYTPYGSNIDIALSSGAWLFDSSNSVSTCSELCAYACSNDLGGSSVNTRAFRTAMFGLYPSSQAMCEANVININWSDASQTDIDANNAGTATYGEDVRTPVKAATKKGKTFRGWRFSTPEQTNLSE